VSWRTDCTPTNLLEAIRRLAEMKLPANLTLWNNAPTQYPTCSLVTQKTYCNTYAYTSLMIAKLKLVRLPESTRGTPRPAYDAAATRYAAITLPLARIGNVGCDLNGA